MNTSLAPLRLAAWFIALALVFSAKPALGQDDPTKPLVANIDAFSGAFDGDDPARSITARRVASIPVTVPNAKAIRVHFEDVSLGSKSYVIIRSRKDGAEQRLDAISMAQWRNKSAVFNGASVDVSLYAMPGDRGIALTVTSGVSQSVATPKGFPRSAGEEGIPVGGLYGSDSRRSRNSVVFVGGGPRVDDRVSTTSNKDARIKYDYGGATYGGIGTAWLASTGYLISAGHTLHECESRSPSEIIEFDVPFSNPDGTANFAHPNNQYVIDQNSYICEKLGTGNDWGLFNVYPNSNTGLTPFSAEEDFHRLSNGSYQVGETMTAKGHGLDDQPLGTTGGENYQSQTLQVHSAIIDIVYSTWFIASEYDNASGVSGSAVVVDGVAIGIVTHTKAKWPNRPLYPMNGGARSQRLDVSDVESAISNYWGTDVVFADASHPSATSDGSPFRPYKTLDDALDGVPTDGEVHLVKGVYPGAYTITEQATFHANVGQVTIGGVGTSAIQDGQTLPSETLASEDEGSGRGFVLDVVYPNPASVSATVDFSLAVEDHTALVVYDVLGREVMRVVDENRPAGEASVEVSLASLTSGLYFLRLTSGDEVATRRLTVVR